MQEACPAPCACGFIFWQALPFCSTCARVEDPQLKTELQSCLTALVVSLLVLTMPVVTMLFMKLMLKVWSMPKLQEAHERVIYGHTSTLEGLETRLSWL